jgi:colanic acid/amylovoran biosynthesis glycosyltransferase
MSRIVVANINTQYFAGSETFMYNYLSSFRRIHPICLSQAKYVNTDLFPFPSADCYRAIAQRYTPSWFLHEILRRLTGRLISAERVLSDRKAQLIHAHYGPVGWWALPLQKKLNLTIVTNFYGFDVAPVIKEQGPDWSKRRQQLFDEGDLFLVEGPFMQQRLIELGCSPAKIKLQHIAIKVENLPFRGRLPRYCGKVVILFAGRFYEKKGLIYALQSVWNVFQKSRNIEFRVIGDGPLMTEVRAFVNEHGMENYVRFLGFLNHTDYLREMQDAEIFLHPSVTATDGDSEGGAPTTILEAQALGMPVVSTYHADIPYIVVPGESAILVPERNIPALTDALLYLIDHPERWDQMGHAGRKHVETYHNVDSQVALLEEKYFTLLQNMT